jgi:hypothetical protein
MRSAMPVSFTPSTGSSPRNSRCTSAPRRERSRTSDQCVNRDDKALALGSAAFRRNAAEAQFFIEQREFGWIVAIAERFDRRVHGRAAFLRAGGAPIGFSNALKLQDAARIDGVRIADQRLDRGDADLA